MAKISIILPDNLDEEVREYAKKEDLNLTNSCVILLRKGLESEEKEVIDSDKYEKIQGEMKELQKEHKELQKKYEVEREERLKVLDDYKNFNTKLLDLMQADRVLQIQDKPLKKSLGQRIKIFFLGEEEK
ncbi:MAG: hypothetical protein PUG67_08250 [Peptoniphilaceae bacterium]|nr:hypothetical protein [Peptoniphilaceae bacterium]MDY6019372.1 hypothetical protein [Anaerococcus sp.]